MLTVCPFCPSPRVRGRGGLLAASILALGLTACGGAESDDGAPPDETHQTEDTGGGEAAPPEDGDEEPPPEEVRPEDQESRFDDGDDNRAVALYGVAPE